MIKKFLNFFLPYKGPPYKQVEEPVKQIKKQSKSFEHLLFEAENSVENNQRKQNFEDLRIKLECDKEVDRLFWEQLEYSDRYKEMNKTLFGELYNPNKIYGGLIIPEVSCFIKIYSGAKSEWDLKSTHKYIMDELNKKIENWENKQC